MPFSKLDLAPQILNAGTTVIKVQGGWESFWRQHGGVVPTTPVDFDRQLVLGVFYSQRAGCTFEVDMIKEVRQARGLLTAEVGPLPDLGLCRMVVFPIDVVIVEVGPSAVSKVRFAGRVP